MRKNRHLSDEVLLLALDGELAPRRLARAHKHLETCMTCRVRSAQFERTLARFIEAHHGRTDSQISPAAVPIGRLSSSMRRKEHSSKLLPLGNPGSLAWWNLAGAGALVLLLGVALRFVLISPLPLRNAAMSFLRNSPRIEPKPNLTPGVAHVIAASDICTGKHESGDYPIPGALQKKVFQEYGLANATPADYEIDYLITPELGGTTDVRNLWPEPYRLTEWNAYAKDALENLLHKKVCSGEIDLTTAQHEIATDWVSAYKKYFSTDRPLAIPPESNPSSRINGIDGIEQIREPAGEELLLVRMLGAETARGETTR